MLARTDGNETLLGLVQSSVSVGLMAGGTFIAARKKQSPDSVRAMVNGCICIFLNGIGLALSRTTAGWCLFAFLQYAFAAIMNAHWGNVMRTSVPTSCMAACTPQGIPCKTA